MDQIYVHIREIIYCYTYMDRIYDHIYETIYECTYMGPIYECWHMNTYMCTSDFHIPPTLEMSPTEIDVLVHSSVYIICKIVYFWKQYITCQLVYKYLPVCKHFTNAFACFWSVGTNKSFNSCIQRFFFTIWRFIFFFYALEFLVPTWVHPSGAHTGFAWTSWGVVRVFFFIEQSIFGLFGVINAKQHTLTVEKQGKRNMFP